MNSIEIDWITIGQRLAQGDLIVYPTETSYAIGCKADNAQAVQRIQQLKERDISQFFPVIVSDIDVLASCGVRVTSAHRFLADAFWPGPLTMLFPLDEKFPDGVANAKEEVAARVSPNPIARRLAEVTSCPIIATSANLAGLPPALTIAEAKNYFQNVTDLFLDGGPLTGGVSTIVRVHRRARAVTVLRQGLVTEAELSRVVTVR